ncbi:MAG: 30S ribosome-binding factor RbfA [Acidimicrobiia bacterium]|nr:30S ribosome-binding factor RbfA [Acidimicrobiia bacterium]
MGDPSYSRMRRVNSIIRQVLAEQVEVLKDPRLGIVSITGVETAPNLRNAVVYFSALDQSTLDDTKAALEAAAPRLRRELGRQVRMKYTPALEFRPDHGITEGERIDAALRRLNEAPQEEPTDE